MEIYDLSFLRVKAISPESLPYSESAAVIRHLLSSHIFKINTFSDKDGF